MKIQRLFSRALHYKYCVLGYVLSILLSSIINTYLAQWIYESSCRNQNVILKDYSFDPNLSQKSEGQRSSTCSKKATQTGFGQKVISFSLFIQNGARRKSIYERFGKRILDNFKKMREFYPGWVMRLYTNIPKGKNNLLEKLDREVDFFLCNMLPGNLSEVNERLWRFLLIDDPTVDIFLSRDFDSLISSRERSAVAQWESSNKPFHAMRDHPYHIKPIMTGLWGANNGKISGHLRTLLSVQFMEMGKSKNYHEQNLLQALLYIPFKHLFMIHDSYICETLKDSIPFPVKRTDMKLFVGSNYLKLDSFKVTICPIACRPSYGKDWEFC